MAISYNFEKAFGRGCEFGDARTFECCPERGATPHHLPTQRTGTCGYNLTHLIGARSRLRPWIGLTRIQVRL